jgi:hypothetical protein
MRDEDKYHRAWSRWYGLNCYSKTPPKMVYHSVSCVCPGCLQTDYNAAFMTNRVLDVLGL